MQKLTDIEQKRQVLKTFLSGKLDFSILRPPQHYCIWLDENGLYHIPNGDLLCDEEYRQWLATIRDCDSVILIVPQEGYPVIREAATCPVAALEALQTVDTDYEVVDTITQEEPLKSPVNALQVVPRRLIREGKLSEYGISWGSICGY